MSAKLSERLDAIERLRGWLKPGDTVHTILESVSRSGMSRVIRPVLIRTDTNGEIYQVYPGYNIGTALRLRVKENTDGGVVMQGGGMDMGFELVYSLSRTLFPHGFGCIGARCPSNDHSNGDRNEQPHSAGEPTSFGEHCMPTSWEKPGHVHWHTDGGYALKHRWL